MSALAEAWSDYGGWLARREHDGWQNARCAIHEDRSPSARVNLGRNAWTCNVCCEGGDLWDLVKIKEGVGFTDAKRIAYERWGYGEPPGGPSLNTKKPGRKKWSPPWL